MQYTVNALYTTSHSPVAINLDTNCTVTKSATVSENDIITEKTALTYGDGGFVYANGKLSLSKLGEKIARGDANGDGRVTVFDTLYMLNAVLNKTGISNSVVSDMNGDGELMLADVVAILKKLV